MKEKLKILWELFSVMFKVGLCTFGGGIAMLPILELELVEKRGWTTSEELLDWFAIGQSTPGIIAVNVATFTGYKKLGVIGGCVSTFGMVFPSLIIITIIALFINNFAELVWVQKALRGINVAVAAILTSAVYKFSKKSVKNIFGFILLVISFLLIFVFNVGTIWIILGSCILGILIAVFRGDFKKVSEKENSASDGNKHVKK
ncbi:chromate transporter [Treponema sp. UBA7567]|uniref:chromate transporter n=1 Tax=Treponema sp. UBA7567 TaxID=1947748 RepID=UPI0025DD55D1|nr:chromate transporter [Treponema sp. UBA7567]